MRWKQRGKQEVIQEAKLTQKTKKTHVESKTGPKKPQTRILRLNKATQRGMRT